MQSMDSGWEGHAKVGSSAVTNVPLGWGCCYLGRRSIQGTGGLWEISVLPLDFADNLKLLFKKMKSIKCF